jgi:Na+/melibiose symporter-like transporter
MHVVTRGIGMSGDAALTFRDHLLRATISRSVTVEEKMQSMGEVARMLKELITARRETPADDVVSGLLAAEFAARDVLVVGGAILAVVALIVSIVWVRDTADHVALEQADHDTGPTSRPPRLRDAFARATFREPALRSCSQAGLVNNLNDGLAWGLVPLYLAAHGHSVGEIALVAALYPSVWSIAQIGTGHLSDHVGRKPLITIGMLVQAAALGGLAVGDGELGAASAAAVLLGLGTALVYPTLIAAISDAVDPVTRAPVLGVYRFWRDIGYALGAIIAGATADALGYGGAIGIVAGLTAISGLWVLRDMPASTRLTRTGPEADPAILRAS